MHWCGVVSLYPTLLFSCRHRGGRNLHNRNNGRNNDLNQCYSSSSALSSGRNSDKPLWGRQRLLLIGGGGLLCSWRGGCYKWRMKNGSYTSLVKSEEWIVKSEKWKVKNRADAVAVSCSSLFTSATPVVPNPVRRFFTFHSSGSTLH